MPLIFIWKVIFEVTKEDKLRSLFIFPNLEKSLQLNQLLRQDDQFAMTDFERIQLQRLAQKYMVMSWEMRGRRFTNSNHRKLIPNSK